MTVTIRKRKLKEGRYALYLDLYAHQKQWQENLKLYLENEKGNPAKKQMNKQTYMLAEKIQTERLYQLQNDAYGFKKPTKTYRTGKCPHHTLHLSTLDCVYRSNVIQSGKKIKMLA
ncbi:hypothetical protein CHU92_00570 [Flavobacterium cyanobacteriorum]|uniref:Arm DNA-binding domain-containing protein n=1 Tax=Flavobacterium cyanobacteriorum TaxID=2022802 RepID=A0A256A4W3_9FLAO|nr:Arm DNA-binding domain-containing protein [Flavobacterium cyanobacteriorum]OYQ48671.1 hypothetical protein CHU92_00570 [Flavobacterium cyanobacteriorum]